METLMSLTSQLSNAAQMVFLAAMIYIAFARLSDGKREGWVEKISLYLIALGAFFQMVKAAHPSGTSWDVLITHLGVVLWMFVELYRIKYKQHI